MASRTSAYPSVRAALLNIQENVAKTADILMDGRDIGTNVLPDAGFKNIFDGFRGGRAKRRYDELIEKGQEAILLSLKKI